jgi:hypothetical protein
MQVKDRVFMVTGASSGIFRLNMLGPIVAMQAVIPLMRGV